MVRQWQEFFYDRNYEATPLLSPDFVKLAEAYGIRSDDGYRAVARWCLRSKRRGSTRGRC